MANTERGWCPRCKESTDFYNIEIGTWECDVCGYAKDDYDDDDYYEDDEYDDDFEDEFDE